LFLRNAGFFAEGIANEYLIHGGQASDSSLPEYNRWLKLIRPIKAKIFKSSK